MATEYATRCNGGDRAALIRERIRQALIASLVVSYGYMLQKAIVEIEQL